MNRHRKGMAIYAVLLIMVALFLVIFSMIRISGQMRGASADQRQKLRARLAAEGAVSLAEADILEVGADLYAIPTGYKFSNKIFVSNGDTGRATTTIKPVSQGVVTTGSMTGLSAYVYPVVVSATGTTTGGAKAPFGLELDLYQVPLFQFGQFGEGGLGFNYGVTMSLMGPIHSNGDIGFSPNTATTSVQGPVTAHKSICWNNRVGGTLAVYKTPTNSANPWSVGQFATGCVGPGSGPPSTGSYSPMTPNGDSLGLPVAGGATLVDLMQLADPTDPQSLRIQKFDWIVQDPTKASAANARYIAGITSKPWVTGPFRFFLRNTWRWCRFWKVDVGAMLAATGDSLFVFADTVHMLDKDPLMNDSVVNAFVLYNGSNLSRNLSISSPNPIMVAGDYNATSATTRNCMVASPKIYNLSLSWLNPAYDNTFARGSFAGPWNLPSPYYRTYNQKGPNCVSNSVSSKACYTSIFGYVPASITQNTAFLGATVHVIEDWLDNQSAIRHTGATNLKGSFVVPSKAAYIGSRYSDFSNQGNGGGSYPDTSLFYSAPVRNLAFDTRFSQLANMPPFTPFLASLSQKQWREGP